MNGVHCQTSATMTDQQRVLADPVRLRRAVAEDLLEQPVEQAVLRVVERVLPEQGRRDRHDEERRDHHRADDAPAAELAVQQQRDAQARGRSEIRTTETVSRMVTTIARRASGSVSTVAKLRQPGEAALVGVVGVPVHERDHDRHHERQLGDHDHEDQGGQQRARRAQSPARLQALAGLGRSVSGRRLRSGGASWRQAHFLYFLAPRSRPASAPCSRASSTVVLPGDGRADVLAHLGAEVGELGDVDELDAGRRTRLHARVVRVGRLDRGLGRLGEGPGGLEVVGVVVGRGALAGRAPGTSRAGCRRASRTPCARPRR